jgi:hypothetical protein
MRVTSIAAIFILLVAQPACNRVSVAVFDGDTNQPISEAKVEAHYMHKESWLDYTIVDWFRAQDEEATTGANGIARIRVRKPVSLWTITAPGYLEYDQRSGQDIPQQMDERQIQGKNAIAIPLYRQPPPEIWIILPDGYRGPVRITQTPVNRWVQESPGQRTFEFHASATGDVQIESTPLLHRIIPDRPYGHPFLMVAGPPGFRFRYASGQELPRIDPGVFDQIRVAQKGGRKPPPRPPEPAFAIVSSDAADDSPTATKRMLCVVGGEKEMTAIDLLYRSMPPRQGFEAAWNQR